MKHKYYRNFPFLICLFTIVQHRAIAQHSTTRAFVKLSRPEKWWAFTHPFIACKAFNLTVKAREASNEMMNDTILDHDGNGGQVDAFRHGYWMALLSQKISTRKAKKLGVAHEKGDYLAFKKHRMQEGMLPDSMASVMDLCNNDSGIAIGGRNKKLTKEELMSIIKQKVVSGEMHVLLKNGKGTYLTCDGNEIDMQLYLHQWNTPKCLVRSNRKEKH